MKMYTTEDSVEAKCWGNLVKVQEEIVAEIWVEVFLSRESWGMGKVKIVEDELLEMKTEFMFECQGCVSKWR